ncbi:unnamed protein product [Rotaria socialis]|uniref:Septin-type G domain-containing protein n=1 Tax=Rotaria socialis TaxID=392032 RepID=A0A820RFJ6_9BILA|nr:unnamed protein product [Rotaria socialis]CAF4437014.1 unnamed protein product [Rotaria socialis]
MSSTTTIESPSKSSTTSNRFHTNGIETESLSSTATHSNGNGVTAVVVTNPLASSSFSSTTSRYQSSVMNKYKNLATPDLTHPLSSLKQMTHILTNNNGNNTALDSHSYLASKYRRPDTHLRSTTSTPNSTPTKTSVPATNESTTVDGPPPVAPPPPPPPPPPPSALPSSSSSTSSVKGPSTRLALDDLHQSPILHSTTTHSHTSNGDYRSTLYPTIVNNPTSTPIPSPPHGYGSSSANNSTISKLIRPRQESEATSINKEQQQTAPRIREISSNVGFVSLPDQVHRRAVKKGFEFNLMVVGQSGLGKSTFINTLFQTELYGQDFPSTVHRKKKTVSIDSSSIILKEKGVQLRLTIVDTPGFGDAVDNSNCWQPIIDYIDSKYEEYLNAESRVVRKAHITDNRVHCCLYFITPTGHSLQALDIEFMKRLHDRVNIIPVIAKADTLTSEELRLFKKSIMQDITNEKMKLYEFPECDDDDDENKLTKIYKDKVPFAVVGSNFILEKGNKRTRIRQYAWGIVDVEDEVHSDFIALRSMLIRTNLNDLRDVTHNIHYENYRYKKLSAFHGNDTKNGKTLQTPSVNKNFLSQLEDERIETETRLEKMSRDMEAVYQSKVTEKLQKLEESKQNVLKTQETYRLNIQQEEERIQKYDFS